MPFYVGVNTIHDYHGDLFTAQHWTDAEGNPSGGCSYGIGFCVSWQNGPLGRPPERKIPNGAFVETLLEVVTDRLRYYQNSKFESPYNQRAIGHIEAALAELRARTADRESREVEGTYGE